MRPAFWCEIRATFCTTKKLLMFFYLSLTAGALTRHVNSVHLRTGKTKECPICGYTTASLLNLNSHLSQTHHLGEDIAYHEFKTYIHYLYFEQLNRVNLNNLKLTATTPPQRRN